MDFENDENWREIDCDIFLKDGHLVVPKYQLLVVETYSEEESEAVVCDSESASENACLKDDNFRRLVALRTSFCPSQALVKAL